MKIIESSVKRPVTICMVILCVVLLGFVSLSRLAVDLFPDMKFPVAIAITQYSGVGPEEVESMVTEPLEDVLGTVQNVDKIQSQSMAGQSMVIVWFNWGTDMDFATLQMREKIDLIKGSFPDEVTDPMVMKADPSMMPVVQLGLSGGKDLMDLKKIAEDVVKPRLERLAGVASVSVTGGYTREIQVLADPVKMEAYGIGLNQISQALKGENMNVASGRVTEGKKELYVRTIGEYTSLDDIKNINIALPGGGTVFLKDLAEVKDGFAEQQQYTRMNGEPSVGISVQKQSKANTVQVSNLVQKELDQIAREIPGNVKAVTVYDQATFIRQSIGSVSSHAMTGGVLAILVIYLFLRNLRSTVIIGLAIPISIIGIFSVLYMGGLTLNMMSLGGLALGIGHLVDCSIVVLESIFRYREDGYSLTEAAIKGGSEVGMPVIASTLTVMVVFLPIVFVQGLAAMLFRELALTVASSQGVALLVALTLVPMLSSKLLAVVDKNQAAEGESGKQNALKKAGSKVGDLFGRLEQAYGKGLAWSLAHRKRVVLIVVAAMVASLALVPVIGMEFMPKVDSGELAISVELDKGTVLSETNKVAEHIETVLGDIKEVKTVFTSVGAAGDDFMGSSTPEVSQMRVMLVPKAERQRSADQVADDIRQRIQEIPGADISVTVSDSTGGGGQSSAPVSIQIRGDDLDVLKSMAEEIVDVVKSVPGTREVESSITVGRPELQIRVNRDKAAAYGLSVSQVASAVRAAFEGDVATKYRTGGDEIDVRVILPEHYRENVRDLKDVIVPTANGAQVALSDLVITNIDAGPTQIDRENQARTATINSQLSGRDVGSVTKDIQAKLKDFKLPQGYTIEYGGENADMIEAFSSLGLAMILAIILTYMVMASQFESLVHPFVIMFSIPTMIIGVIGGLALTGRSFSVTTFIGLIMLTGIVVNNAIVLVDYINVLRRRGLSRNEAITKAGPIRLRPVLMTALTTILGMVPLALGIGEGAETQAPMATAVVGGLSTSTIFTLIFVPVMYTIIDDFGQWLRRVFRLGAKKKSISEGEVIS
ncbi:efflux RND transporter permease subunit [Candidatus Formimonas warabiya]|uniref:Multidrug ABC transporter n=1 Tax=Formimonas warabiya TaxID=1761012 RepID=A0A3G1KU66_FORW1|nr:efflux RND transporter permease subunit [Candidatus Formimonas warabiya]ATW25954.1 multidrug ABC transporter [Candidatus Formimonas warabiya]